MTAPPPVRLEREWKVGRPLIGCRFDPAGRFLFASAEDSTVRRLDLLTGATTTFAGHASWVRGMAFVPEAPTRPVTVVSGDYHGNLVWWPGDVAKPTPIRTVAAHDGWVRAVAVSPDGATVASCGNDRLVKLWNAADGAPIRTLAGHDAHVYNLAFHPAGRRLVSCDLKGVVKDWDLATGACGRDLDAKALHKYDPVFRADIGGARGMGFDPAGGRLACCGIGNVSNAFAGVGNPLVAVFDWPGGKPKLLKPKEAFQGTAWGVAFLSAGAVVAAGGGSGGRVWVWAGDDAASTHTVAVPANARDLAAHPAGDRFAVAGANGTAYLYSFDPAVAGKS